MLSWLYLLVAIASEVVATTSLKASETFTKLVPSLLVFFGCSVSFYFMTLALRTLPLSIVYPVWSGTGNAIIIAVGFFYFREQLDIPALIGISLILLGVFTLFTFSNTTVR